MQDRSTILLVDESRFFLTIENQFLRRAPVNILEAGSTREALEVCRREKPHLIYLAFELSDQPGVECCRQIKADPALQDIPVILICNENAPEQVAHCQASGCDAILTKPLDRHRFLEIGRSFLAGVRETRRTCLITVQAGIADKTLQLKGLDISSGGIFLECTEPIAIGSVLDLELQLARPNEAGPRIKCHGRVTWINTRDNPMKPHHPVGLGIKFTDMPAQSASVLNGFLKTMERSA